MRTVLVLAFFGVAVRAQLHGTEVSCYDCHHGHGHHGDQDFPACLDSRITCHGEEICQVKYGNGEAELKCRKQKDCQRDLDRSTRSCPNGGYEVHDRCQLCCQDDACLQGTLGVVMGIFNASFGMHCPADCAAENVVDCVNRGQRCMDNQFCQVTLDGENLHIHGKCVQSSEMQVCMASMSQDSCPPGGCVVGCCTSDDCVAGTLGGQTTALWDFLTGDCVDQLEEGQCSQLEHDKHLCGDKLALRLCPETCALCEIYNSTDCHDTVLNNGCETLKVVEDICNHEVGIDICPVTCNLCDKWIERVVDAKLASMTTTQAPSTDVTTVDVPGDTTIPPTGSSPFPPTSPADTSSPGDTDSPSSATGVQDTTVGVPDTSVGVQDTTVGVPDTSAGVSGTSVQACVDDPDIGCGSVAIICESSLEKYCPVTCGLCT